MPGGRGLDLLDEIVSTTAVPVVVISGVTRRAAATTLRALELGAVDFVLKYTPGAPITPAILRREIRDQGQGGGERQAGAADARSRPRLARRRPAPPSRTPRARDAAMRVVVIGASTGGPQALRELLAAAAGALRAACVIVQHLPASFATAFTAQLARYSRLPVEVARATRTGSSPGVCSSAPGGASSAAPCGTAASSCTPADGDAYRPSIDAAMTSAAETYGAGAAGVVLSGMGSDGAEGLRCIRAAGGQGYVQDPATCVIGSMPARAIERAGADYIAPADRIGAMLARRGRS